MGYGAVAGKVENETAAVFSGGRRRPGRVSSEVFNYLSAGNFFMRSASFRRVSNIREAKAKKKLKNGLIMREG